MDLYSIGAISRGAGLPGPISTSRRLARTMASVIAGLAWVAAGCAGIGPTVFVHPDYNFDYVEKVAIVPFENLTPDQGAGARVTRYFTNELLASGSFEVIEPGEVTRALEKQSLVRTAELTQEQAVALGKELGVQGIFLGSIGESSTVRDGTANVNVVTLSARFIETDKGMTVWSSTHTEGGRGFWARLFGTGERSQGEVTRRCVEKTLATLID